MTTENIRQQLEKLRALQNLYSNLLVSQGSIEDKETVLKMKVAKEQMLKVTYKVGQLLKQIEERV